MAEVTDSNFTELVRQLKTSNKLHIFFHELGIHQNDVEAAEEGANTPNAGLKGRAVLRGWRSRGGREVATCKAILEALQKSKFVLDIESLQKTSKDWCVSYDTNAKSTSDFTAVIEAVGTENLDDFFLELKGMTPNDLAKVKMSAKATDVELIGKAVLLTWQQRQGKAATCGAILDAIKKCGLTEPIQKLQDIWPKRSDTLKYDREATLNPSRSQRQGQQSVASGSQDETDSPEPTQSRKRKRVEPSGSEMGNQGKGHVMISYTHEVAQERMLKLDKELTDAGYVTWIDENEMEGNMPDRMAEGVAKAAVVLVCFSKKYQASKYCKQEAQYADSKKQKKYIIPLKCEDYTPDGWLGLMINALLYYDVQTDEAMMNNLPKIKMALDKQGVTRHTPGLSPQHSSSQKASWPRYYKILACIMMILFVCLLIVYLFLL